MHSREDAEDAGRAREILQRTFGFDDFREGQEPVISRLLAGRSALAVFPTGSGKSLCYQLPALLLDGLTLVISPLIALMKDQIDFLVSRNVPAARLDSTLDRDETLQVYQELNSGRLKLLYVSPERLGNERFLHCLRRLQISLLAVDEAHCISEWGHNFRPDYLKIARLARQLNVGRVLTLTATATPQVARDVAREFDVADEDMIQTGFYRPNLKLYVTPCEANQRNGLLLQRMADREPGPAIVYVTLQRTAEEVADLLASHGHDARAYHAGMEADQRAKIQDTFMASPRMTVVATIAFGMGVDKADIRYVYHYNLPKALENYAQEIGRAGRDGADSICELLACADDVVALENFSYGDTPTAEQVTAAVGDVFNRGDVFDVSEYELAGRHDVRPVVVRTLLTYLELAGVIRATGPFYSEYKFQPQKSSQEILAQFDEPRADFLRGVFRHARRGRTWFTLDVDQTARSIGEARQRIVAALGYLEESGDLIVQAAGVRQGYCVEQLPDDLALLCRELAEKFQHRERQDIARVQRMLALAEHDGCLTQFLLSYFGETRDACGHCGRCEGITAAPLPPARYKPPDNSAAGRVRAVRAERHDALATSRQLIRFLCGLSSPATSKAKLRRHPMFGVFSSVPFHEVAAFVEAGS
ncbi:MAG: RecQ family ATP-dependent DNA helicase [Candidatus Nealsonbacteria bacterium]|nr:RecQ family ATP-dependent DNA helicase [Candidatus Nealsonbacteria bacterium]